eukprot:2644439-Amphidinium_carterae.2
MPPEIEVEWEPQHGMVLVLCLLFVSTGGTYHSNRGQIVQNGFERTTLHKFQLIQDASLLGQGVSLNAL